MSVEVGHTVLIYTSPYQPTSGVFTVIKVHDDTCDVE